MILYKSLVKPALTYNFGTWGLAVKEAHERDVACTPIPTRKAMPYYFEIPKIQRSTKEKKEQFLHYLLNNSRQ